MFCYFRGKLVKDTSCMVAWLKMLNRVDILFATLLLITFLLLLGLKVCESISCPLLGRWGFADGVQNGLCWRFCVANSLL